ncbi:hypothetical protein KP509_1Z168900 [Ceratopteris richardii]|nr:hypothetical protein KP509_1Z168900 [Ceratopteris richardii]
MPSTRVAFVKDYFGSISDIRVLQTEHIRTRYGLERFSQALGVKRICGMTHQIGSDSLLTMKSYTNAYAPLCIRV